MEARSGPVRDTAFDALKGLLIATVLLHHSSTFCGRFHPRLSWEWYGLVLGSRVFHFAVPSFLLLAMLLLARSESHRERFDARSYYGRRLAGLVVPFLLWSIIFYLLRIYVFAHPADTRMVDANWFGWRFSTYPMFAEPADFLNKFVTGKAYFHLYFLSVLIQAAVVFPLMLAWLRRWRPSLGLLFATAIGLQIAVYGLQKIVRYSAPASIFLWYLPALLVGVWLGLHSDQVRGILARWRFGLSVLALCSLGGYGLAGYWSIKEVPYESILNSLSGHLFAVSVGLLLLYFVLGRQWAVRSPWVVLGIWSLPIYLVHVAFLPFLIEPAGGLLRTLHLAGPLVLAFCLAVASMATTYLLVKLRGDRLLFGRRLTLDPMPTTRRRIE